MGNGREHLASGRGRKASGKGNLHPWQVAEACFLGSVQATLEKPSIDFPVETLVVAIPDTRKSLQSLIFYFPERSEEDLIKILGLSRQSGWAATRWHVHPCPDSVSYSHERSECPLSFHTVTAKGWNVISASALRKCWHTLQLFCTGDLQSHEHSSVILKGFKNKLCTDFANLLSLVSVEMYWDCKEHLCAKQLIKGNTQCFVLPQEG